MFHEVGLLPETVIAENAGVGSNPGVGSQVNVQVGLGGQNRPAHGTPGALLIFLVIIHA